MRKTFIPRPARLVILFPLFLFISLVPFLHTPCSALDEGGGTASVEYRNLNRDTPAGDLSEYEAVSHVDLWQTVPNVGRVELWLDWVHSRNSSDLNRLGRGFLAIREFRFRDAVFNGWLGDASMLFTNLPEKFTNVTYPDIYFRGGKGQLLFPGGEVLVFGGRVARLQGIIGEIYDVTDESLYGFRGHLKPVPWLLLGTGFIRTENETDSADRPVTRHNHIMLFDSEIQVTRGMKWLTEYRRSTYKGEPGTESRGDFMLRLGPILKTDTLRLEGNFRRIGTNYRFVSDSTQTERDQEGFFLLAEYKPFKDFLFFGNADRYRDNVADQFNRNTTDSQRGLLGASLFSSKYPSFYVTLDRTERKSRSALFSPVDNLTTTFHSEVRYQICDLNPYVRFRRVDYRDDIVRTAESVQNVLTLGLRQNLKTGSALYIEGESDRKTYHESERETRLSGKAGFSYFSSPKLSGWGEVIYSRLKDRTDEAKTNKLEGALGLSYELPYGIQLYSDLRYDRLLSPHRDEMKSEGFQATLRVTKRFRWGARESIAGLKPGAETKGSGRIEGMVFNDINRNGRQDAGEEGVRDITIRLEDGSSVKTDEKGAYQFPRVETGGHQVTLEGKRIPAEYSLIGPETVKVEIAMRETLQIRFPLIRTGRILGWVVEDPNQNGKREPGEKGIPDVLVLLEPGDLNTYTDEEGRFVFENILPGDYTMRIDSTTLPEEIVFTSPSEWKLQVGVGDEQQDRGFLIHIKPRPIRIGPPSR